MGSKHSIADRIKSNSSSIYKPLIYRGHPFKITILPKENHANIRDTIINAHFIQRNGKLYIDGLFVSINRHGRTSHVIEIDQEKNIATTSTGHIYRFVQNVCDLQEFVT